MSEEKSKLLESSEDSPISELPESSKKNMFSMMNVLLGFTFFTSTMFGGGQIGPHYRLIPDLVGVILIGASLLGIYVAALSYIAQKTGYNSAVLARYSFGDKGSKLVDTLFAVTQFGWYAWGVAAIAMIIVNLLGLRDFWLIPLMIFFGYAFGSTSYIGYRGIELLSNVAVPAMIILMIVTFTIGFKDAGGLERLTVKPESTISFAAALTVVFGTFVSGGTQSTNWTRFAKTPRIAVVASLVAFTIGHGLMVFTGAFGGYVYGTPDVVEVMLLQGLRISAVVMLLLNMWTTQDNAMYAASVAACNFFRTEKRRLMNFIGCTLSIILAIAGMYNWLIPYITIMGTVIPPIGGVIMADYFIKRKGNMPGLTQVKMKNFNWAGLTAYVIGSVFAYYSPGVAPINGIIVSVIVYSIADKIFSAIGLPQEHALIEGAAAADKIFSAIGLPQEHALIEGAAADIDPEDCALREN